MTGAEPCRVVDCDRPTRTRQLCNAHYIQVRNGQRPRAIIPRGELVVPAQSRRCAECSHTRSRHDAEGCLTCACDSWAERRVHRWRDMITDAHCTALLVWESQREAFAVGYACEMAEFEELNPRPRLADFMRALSSGACPASNDDVQRPTDCCTEEAA